VVVADAAVGAAVVVVKRSHSSVNERHEPKFHGDI
jgi:hypothetical protein